jgi:hypothetical protein
MIKETIMKAKALAVAAVLGLAPALAYAQDATTLPATPEAPAIDAQVGAAADFDMFLQGFGAADYTSATSSIDTATTFNVVKISTLANADATRLQDAIGPHQADIASLSTRIEANAAAKAALDAQGVAAANVVWVETGADGAVTLYVNDLGAM